MLKIERSRIETLYLKFIIYHACELCRAHFADNKRGDSPTKWEMGRKQKGRDIARMTKKDKDRETNKRQKDTHTGKTQKDGFGILAAPSVPKRSNSLEQKCKR